MANARLSQAMVEVLYAAAPNVRFSQAMVEVLYAGIDPGVRMSQSAVEVLYLAPVVDIRMSQSLVELLYMHTWTRMHGTDLRRWGIMGYPHATDGLAVLVSSSPHGTDLFAFASIARRYTTSTMAYLPRVPSHGSDVRARAPGSSIHGTDTSTHGLFVARHYADGFAARSVARVHTADTSVRSSGMATHRVDVAVHGIVSTGHGTDAAMTTPTSRIHGTSIVALAGRVPAHTADVLMRSRTAPSHSMDLAARGSPARTHGTSVRAASLPTRSHSGDVATKSMAVAGRGGSPRAGTRVPLGETMQARQLGGTLHPIGFALYDIAGRPADGRQPVVTLAKDGAVTWVPAHGTVVGIGNGWYSFKGDMADRDTPGMLLIHVEATGCRPVDLVYDVILPDPYGLPVLGANERTVVVDALLTRSWIGLGGLLGRHALNALRVLRNRRAIDASGVLRVHGEDNATVAWQAVFYGSRDATPVRGVTPD